jgi:hypothetical protein
MADVWFAKDGSSPSSSASSSAAASHETSSAPSLGDLLAAPSSDLLPGGEKVHVSPVHAGDHSATAAMVHGLLDARRLDEDEPGRHAPLI